MTQFDKIISGTTGIRTALIYGRTDELVIGPDRVIMPSKQYIANVMRRNGYQNVLFFDASHTIGKYVYDDVSAYYSFPDNRAAYISKYGSAPDGETVPPAAPQNPDIRFDGSAQEIEYIREGGLIYQQRDITDAVFYSELFAFLMNTDVRTAVVITNMIDMIGHSEIRRNIMVIVNELLENKRRNMKNLLLFFESDLHDSLSSDALMHSLTNASMRERFMVQKDPETWVLDENRTFCIGRPCEDELMRLLWIYSRQNPDGRSNRLVLKGDMRKLADSLLFHLRDGCERVRASGKAVRDASLRDVIEKIQEKLDASDEDLVIDSDNIGMLSPYPSQREQDPERKLRQTKGWETVCEPVFTGIRRFRRMHPEFGTAAEQPVESDVIMRLSKASGRVYPDASQLPHVMLTGEPGVGKSVVARLLGQIYHKYGMLASGHTVEAKASDLISQNIGGTAPLVMAAVEKAEGGVLFIDESYYFYADRSERGRAGNYKEEALTCLVQALTDPTHHFLLVLAGYPNSAPGEHDGTEALFEMNQGLRSRMRIVANIPSYPSSLLTEIAVSAAKEMGCTLEGSATVTYKGMELLFENMLRKRNRREWANARSVLMYMESVIGECLCRCTEAPFVLEAEDFPEPDRIFLSGKVPGHEENLAKIDKDYPGLGRIAGKVAKEAIARECSARNRARARGEEYKEGRISKHLIFCGKPGCGKTTIAKALPGLYGAAGLMSGTEAVCLYHPASCTPEELDDKIRSAREQNTVLLIDEAYALREDLIVQLLSPMTEYSDLLVIFNLYPHELIPFFDKNPGLCSRCDVYDIDDYTPDEMSMIFDAFAAKAGYEVEETCREDLKYVFRKNYALRDVNKNFANARDVENLFGKMTKSLDIRQPEGPFILTAEDLPADAAETIRISKQGSDLDTVLSELDQYVGLDHLRRYITALRKEQDYNAFMHLDSEQHVSHMVFAGPPGTCKTTAAHLIARAFYALGILHRPDCLELSAKDLIGRYVGETDKKTYEALKKGAKGVILIDEAYMLTVSAEDNANSDYRAEAVAQLLLFLEEEQGETVVIFAGYPDEMQKLLNSNPGFRSRVQQQIAFPAYSNEECLEILRRMLAKEKEHLTLAQSAEGAAVFRIMQMKQQEGRYFGNGRAMRNLAAEIAAAHRMRILAEHDRNPAAAPEELHAYEIVEADIPSE